MVGLRNPFRVPAGSMGRLYGLDFVLTPTIQLRLWNHSRNRKVLDRRNPDPCEIVSARRRQGANLSLILIQNMLSLATASVSFSPMQAPILDARVARACGPVCQLEGDVSRRSALLKGVSAGAGLAVAVSLPQLAFADDNEDAMARIAAKATAANEAEKQAKKDRLQKRMQKGKTEEQEIEEKAAQSKNLVLGIGAGGTLLSTAFFYRNIQRLFTKVTSGGEDDGYTVKGAKGAKGAKGKKAVVEDEGPSQAEKLFSAVFSRPLNK